MFLLLDHIVAAFATAHSHVHSIKVLQASARTGNVQAEVGDLGIYLPFANGEWIAIRYEDSHAHPGWSMAVALDSKGGWYMSEHHFCGSLRGYRHTVEKERIYSQAMREMGETNTVQWAAERGDLHKLATAQDLKSAIPYLLRIGFHIREE